MEIVISNPSLLKKSMEIVGDIVMEGTFVFKKDYVELIALNPNNVVMIIFRLLSTNFEKYEIEENQKISLNLENLSSVLKKCDDNSKLVLKNDNGSKLSITSEGKNKKDFELSLIEISEENLQNIPNLTFKAKINLQSQEFTKSINDLDFADNGIRFMIKEKNFTIEGKNNSMSGKIDFKEDVNIEMEEEQDINCLYSVDYLKKFIKAEKLTKEVDINFNSSYPLKIEYKILDKLLLSFILAPRDED